jgi:hypothetical protein
MWRSESSSRSRIVVLGTSLLTLERVIETLIKITGEEAYIRSWDSRLLETEFLGEEITMLCGLFKLLKL